MAKAFVAAVECAINERLADPLRWRIVESPEIRRYVFRRFPYILYYRWESAHDRISIYALMHCSREPGYWRHRIAS